MIFAAEESVAFRPSEIAPVLSAAGVIVLGVLAWMQNRAGRKDTREQQIAARRLEEREHKFEELVAAKDAYKELTEGLRSELEALRSRRDKEIEDAQTRHDTQIQRLKDRLDVKDAEVHAALASAEATRAACGLERQRMSEVVAMLTGALRSEVHSEMLRLSREAADAHGDSTEPPH